MSYLGQPLKNKKGKTMSLQVTPEGDVCPERRRAVRVISDRPVVMKANDSTVFAVMTDFSKHGLGFKAMCNVQPDDQVWVHFDVPYLDDFKSFCFTATVKHRDQVSEHSHVGVRLDIEENEYTSLFEKIVSV